MTIGPEWVYSVYSGEDCDTGPETVRRELEQMRQLVAK